jgi:hypothetical protein
VSVIAPAAAIAGHNLMLDHPAPPIGAPGGLPSSNVNTGGPGAEWELIDTFTTGNPHTDIDFFSQGGETYVAAGTLGIGANGGGQTIVKLTDGGAVSPSFVSSAPTASCITDASASTGLQHDVEAAPKGDVLLNTTNPFADRSDTQVLVDATDAPGRCHDQGVFGLPGTAPQGGLEIIDVTDVANPVEIGLTSHIGEAHTVNVDPKRPHIAYAVSSDLVSQQADANDIDGDGDTEEMIRENDDPADSGIFDLDGFEVVDFSSCMNLPAGATLDNKRAACRPEVYRYRYPTAEMALGHTIQEGGFGCHELEVYPNDRLTCASGNALIVLDMSGAFDDMGTPTDFSDDKPRGTPLPCEERPSSSEPPFGTGATVIDCVDGTAGDPDGTGPITATNDLTVPGWKLQGAPSLEGVTYLGSIYHQGGGPGQGSVPPFNTLEDLAFNHESELTESGQHLISTDERGGGIFPPGATCTPAGENIDGNGGVHFYKTSSLSTTHPASAEEAQKAYAKTPGGELAIYRAAIRTKAQATVCTSHVFQQIPGENRIFMGWYSQGTQVFDFVEEANGRIRFAEAGFFIPDNANTWVSHIFKTEKNKDGTTTYYGATGDFNLGEAGRNSIDVYKVTLPPAPLSGITPGGSGGGGGGGSGGGSGGGGGGGGVAGACVQKIAGTKKGETLLGSIAGDLIKGRGGDDELKGRAGEDCIRGGGGRDDVRGGAMNDKLNGGRGADSMKGGGGNDTVRDRSGGEDRLGGGGGADKLRSDGGGDDLVLCGKGKDRATVDEDDRTRGCEKVKTR